MVTLTYGAGGVYTNLNTAHQSTPSIWGDVYKLKQVGDCVETSDNILDLDTKDQNGYDLIVEGDLQYTHTLSPSFSFSILRVEGSARTGNVVVHDCSFASVSTSVNNSVVYIGGSVAVNSYTLQIQLCDFDLGDARLVYVTGSYIDVPAFTNTYIYACRFRRTGSTASPVCFLDQTSGYSGIWDIHLEDVTILNPLDTTCTLFTLDNAAHADRIHLKRIYAENITTLASGAEPSDASTEVFVSTNITSVVTDNRGHTWDTSNFFSVSYGDILYGVPNVNSTMTTTASQTTNIPDNIVGLNGIPVSNKAAGAYTPPVFVNPPTDISVEYTGTGVKIMWTDSVLNNPGYENVYIYYETVSAESAFAIPKDSVLGGIQTYTIPYADLSGASVWYVRLQHGA